MKKPVSQPIPDASLPRTSPSAMAPVEKSQEELLNQGGYDLDHLMKAEEIKTDPNRMDYVMKAHKKRTTAMRSIADIKNAAQALAGAQEQASADQDDAPAPKALAKPRAKTRYPKV